jgi:hypothetical protein
MAGVGLLVMILAAACGSSAGPTADASADGAPDPACPSCASDEMCVVDFDGTCRPFAVRCAKKTPLCGTGACTLDCDRELCAGPGDSGVPTLTCHGPSCPTSGQYPGAVLCYGP